VADMHSVATGAADATFRHIIGPDRAPAADQLPMEEIRSRYYLRIQCVDAPGVLAEIAARLGGREISISSVLQKEPPPESEQARGVPVVITTHTALEGSMRRAIEEINSLDQVKQSCVCIDIVDEAPEHP